MPWTGSLAEKPSIFGGRATKAKLTKRARKPEIELGTGHDGGSQGGAASTRRKNAGCNIFTSEIGMPDVVALDNCPYYITLLSATQTPLTFLLRHFATLSSVPVHLSRSQISLSSDLCHFPSSTSNVPEILPYQDKCCWCAQVLPLGATV